MSLDSDALVTLDLNSDTFDTVLRLFAGGSPDQAIDDNLVDFNDDSGDGSTNSLLGLDLVSGQYLVEVGSYEGRGTGQYSLFAFSSSSLPQVEIDGGLIESSLVTSEVQHFLLALENDAIITLNLISGDFDTVVRLYHGSTIDDAQESNLISENDDREEDSSSRLLAALFSGRYVVEIASFQNEGSGAFTLQASSGDAGGGETLVPSSGDGTWTLDLDTSIGDQGERTLSGVSAGQEFTIELINNQSVSPALGGSFILQYDPDQVEPVSGSISGIASLLGGETIESNTISFTLAGLSGISVDQGHIAEISFVTLSGFTGETEIILTKAEIGDASTFENISSEPGVSIVISAGGTTAVRPSPDFDGDGQVAFRDFIMFAQFYGKDPSEFVPPGGKIALSKSVFFAPGLNDIALASLVPASGEQLDLVQVQVRLSEAVQVQGFGLALNFDSSTLDLVSATAGEASLFAESADNASVALQTSEVQGDRYFADVFQSSVSGEATLVTLTFRVIDLTVPGRLEITELLISDGTGRLNQIPGIRLDEVKAIPNDYALSLNYPNPFNPTTEIPFQLPEAGKISLAIYNLLGQQIRVLENGHLPAGYFRLQWDGRDDHRRHVASGVYLYQLIRQGGIHTQRMLLLK